MDDEIWPSPEETDDLSLELNMMGVHIPPRDTAFFQAAVRKWMEKIEAAKRRAG